MRRGSDRPGSPNHDLVGLAAYLHASAEGEAAWVRTRVLGWTLFHGVRAGDIVAGGRGPGVPLTHPLCGTGPAFSRLLPGNVRGVGLVAAVRPSILSFLRHLVACAALARAPAPHVPPPSSP